MLEHHAAAGAASGSPTRKANKENTPPEPRPGLQKEPTFVNHAAMSRQEPYRTRDFDTGTKTKYATGVGISAEDMEKLQKPSVKRLANVTQLCKSLLDLLLLHDCGTRNHAPH